MYLQVIGMPVAATGVVSHHDVGLLVVEDLRDLWSEDIHCDPGESTRRRSIETGICVSQIHHAVNTQDLGRGG